MIDLTSLNSKFILLSFSDRRVVYPASEWDLRGYRKKYHLSFQVPSIPGHRHFTALFVAGVTSLLFHDRNPQITS